MPEEISRPPTQGYSVKALATLWQRVTYTPTSPVNSIVYTRPVRSFKPLPVSSIKLSDMLEGRLTTPFTLREFHDYLVYKAYASQNLCFVLWHRSYTADFNKHYGQQASDPHGLDALPPFLATSFIKALRHFVQPGTMQLNLDHSVRSALLLDSAHCANPSVFLPALYAAEDMLKESLRAFVSDNLGNAGRNRSIFAIVLGAFTILAGIGCLVAFVMLRLSRLWRLLLLPLFFVGAVTAVGGWKKTCLVIWLFGGNVRQLKPWELNRPRGPSISSSSASSSPLIRPPLCHASESFATQRSDITDSPLMEAKDNEKDIGESRSRSASASLSDTSWSMDWDSFANMPTRPGDLEAGTSSEKSERSISAPVFGPLTPISSPFAKLSQRHIMFTAAIYGVWCTVILGAVTLGVPNATRVQ